MATRAACGPFVSGSHFVIAARASFCRRRSIVVFTRSPPPKTQPVWNLSISCCFTYSPK